MPTTLDPTAHDTLVEVFAELGVSVEVLADSSVRLDRAALDATLVALRRVAAADAAAFGPLERIVAVLDGTDTGTAVADGELLDAHGIVVTDGGADVPPGSVLGVVIVLDLAARIESLLEDRDAADAAEELRFLLTAAERRDVGDLGRHVANAAAALGA